MSVITEIATIPDNQTSTPPYIGLDKIWKGPRMTKEFILKHCKEHRLYQTPHLNDVLYLHYKGFSRIENLQEYTGLRCLWLENNGIDLISGLDNQADLRSLFLHYNLIKKIQNLEKCIKLNTLNLSYNQVRKIENLDSISATLQTLNLGNNFIETIEELEHLELLDQVSVLDLCNNHIEDPLVVEVLGRMQSLRVLCLNGNPVVRKIPAYRKTITLACKELRYLDDRPIFPRDRACAEAWELGGITEERAERQRWIDRDNQRIMDSVYGLVRLRDERREMQNVTQRHDSGMGASIADSESEPGSTHDLIEEVDVLEAPVVENAPPAEANYVQVPNNLAENQQDDDLAYLARDQEPDLSENENDFMTDRQPKEDYLDYTENIFDFTPQGERQRPLIEEISDDNSVEGSAPSDSSNFDEAYVEGIFSRRSKPHKLFVEEISLDEQIKIHSSNSDSTEFSGNMQEGIEAVMIEEIKPEEDNAQEVIDKQINYERTFRTALENYFQATENVESIGGLEGTVENDQQQSPEDIKNSEISEESKEILQEPCLHLEVLERELHNAVTNTTALSITHNIDENIIPNDSLIFEEAKDLEQTAVEDRKTSSVSESVNKIEENVWDTREKSFETNNAQLPEEKQIYASDENPEDSLTNSGISVGLVHDDLYNKETLKTDLEMQEINLVKIDPLNSTGTPERNYSQLLDNNVQKIVAPVEENKAIVSACSEEAIALERNCKVVESLAFVQEEGQNENCDEQINEDGEGHFDESRMANISCPASEIVKPVERNEEEYEPSLRAIEPVDKITEETVPKDVVCANENISAHMTNIDEDIKDTFSYITITHCLDENLRKRLIPEVQADDVVDDDDQYDEEVKAYSVPSQTGETFATPRIRATHSNSHKQTDLNSSSVGIQTDFAATKGTTCALENSDNSDDSEDYHDTKTQFYEQLDKIDIAQNQTHNSVHTINVGESKCTVNEIRELLTWQFKPKTENKVFLLPREKKYYKCEPEKVQCEDEHQEECYKRYSREEERDYRSPMVTNILRMTNAVNVIQRGEASAEQQDQPEENPEDPENNALIVSNSISAIRTEMKQFTEELKAYTDKYNQKYQDEMQKFIETYNAFNEREKKLQGPVKDPNIPTEDLGENNKDKYENESSDDDEYSSVESNESITENLDIKQTHAIDQEELSLKVECEEIKDVCETINETQILETESEKEEKTDIICAFISDLTFNEEVLNINDELLEENRTHVCSEEEQVSAGTILNENIEHSEVSILDRENVDEERGEKCDTLIPEIAPPFEDEEVHIIQRNLTCTLEMQLAQEME